MKKCFKEKHVGSMPKENTIDNFSHIDSQKSVPEDNKYNVVGSVHPLRNDWLVRGCVPVGTTIHDAVTEACKLAKVNRKLYSKGVAQIGVCAQDKKKTVWKTIPSNRWKQHTLGDGELLRFRMLPSGGGGGGGGKSPLRTILTIVIAIVAIAASSVIASSAAVIEALGSTGAAIAGSIAGLAITTIGMMLVNAIAPLNPSGRGLSGGGDKRLESSVYGISAGRNAINQWGTVPVPYGTGRYAPPKASSPYSHCSGEDIWLHELYCLGIADGDIDFYNIKIGTTNITDYQDVAYEVFRYSPDDKKSSVLYPTGVFPEDLSIELKQQQGWSQRKTAVCDRIELDLAWPGLGYVTDDSSMQYSETSFIVQYKKENEFEWSQVGLRYYGSGLSAPLRLAPDTTKIISIGVNASGQVQIFQQEIPPDDFYALARIKVTTVPYVIYQYETVPGYYTDYGTKVIVVERIVDSTTLEQLPAIPTQANSKFRVEGFNIGLVNSEWTKYITPEYNGVYGGDGQGGGGGGAGGF